MYNIKILLLINIMSDNTDPDFFGIEASVEDRFLFVKDTDDRELIKAAFEAITICELWKWFSSFNPEDGLGFMFTEGVPELNRLKKEMEKNEVNSNHSGSSYGITMRIMQYISINGYKKFKDSYIKSSEK
jgi:hypothetical protein